MTTFEAIKLMNKEPVAYVLAGAINTYWYIFAAAKLDMSEEDFRSIMGESEIRKMLEAGKDVFMTILDRPVDKEIEEIVTENEATQADGHENLEVTSDV